MPVFPPTAPMVWSRPWAGITDIAAVFPGLAHGSRCSSRFCTVSLVLFFSLAVFLPSVGLTRNVRFWFGRTCGGHACSDSWSFFTFSFFSRWRSSSSAWTWPGIVASGSVSPEKVTLFLLLLLLLSFSSMLLFLLWSDRDPGADRVSI